MQGDVIGIIDSNGTQVVEYTYDVWGAVLSTTGTLASTIGAINPLRYRGYYYDTETGFYYCTSRYYDPETYRWINADGQIASVGGDVLGYNQFTYCFNNPVNLEDSTGNWPKWIKKAATAVKDSVKKVAKVVYEKIVKPVVKVAENVVNDIKKFNINNTDVEEVYESNYFSSYKGTLVLRHSSEELTSCAILGTIFLNHSDDNDLLSDKTTTLNHEYGHILQEKECGTIEYIFKVAIPSVTYFFMSNYNETLNKNYYNMPWEYNADLRGGVNRGYSSWANEASSVYFIVWDVMV